MAALPPHDRPGTGKKEPHILILENEEAHAELIRKGFRKSEKMYRLSFAQSLKEARSVIEKDPANLIIADWLLPDGKGIEILPRVEGLVTTPLVIMTSHGDAKLAVEMMKSGAIDYIIKSDFTLQDLPHIAERALREWDHILERKRAEGALKQSEERFREQYQNNPLPVFTWQNRDGDFVLVDCNRAAEVLTSGRSNDFLGRTASDLYATRPEIISVIRRCLSEQTVISKELVSEHFLPGRLIHTTAAFVPPDLIMVHMEDITERKRAEEALRESEERFRKIFENSPVGMALSTPDFRFVSVNPAMIAMTGYTEEELLRLSFEGITHPDHLAGDREHIRELAAGTIPVYGTEKRYIRKNGSILWGLLKVTTIRDQEGRLHYFAAQIEDITERRRMEDAIRQAGAYNRNLIETSLDPLVTIGPDGRITDVNKAAEEATGLSREELIGTDFSEYFTDPPKAQAGFQKAFREGQVRDYPLELRHTDGGVTSVLYNASVYRDENGQVIGVFAAARDITDYKQAEQALNESEAKFREIFNNVNDAIQIHEITPEWVSGSFIEVNDIACRMLGYTRKELLGMSPNELSTGYHSRPLEALVGELKTLGHSTFETEHKGKDGSIIPVEINAHVSTLQGKPVVISVVRNITDRKAAEDAIRESESKYRLISENSGDVIWILDISRGRFTYVSPSVEKLRGYTAQEVMAQSLQETLTLPSYRDFSTTLFGRVAKFLSGDESQRVQVYELDQPCRDGSVVSTEAVTTILSDPGNKILRMLGVSRNITDRKRAEHALKIANQKLHLMNIVAWHDIQNKVTGLRGYVELSKDLITDPQAQEFLEREEEVLRVIHDHIQNTKEYQELGNKPLQWVNIAETLQMVIDRTSKRQVAVSVDVRDLELYADPIIEKVFSHLLENSIVHGQKTTWVRISCSESPFGITLVFEDDGIGIPEDRKESIFVRDVGKASGFSLFFVHDILELAGMGIKETGEPQKGARFEISVPRGSYRFSRKA